MEFKKIYFWGCELNEDEIKNHRLSYATVSKQFNKVLCNSIVELDESIFDNIESGSLFNYYYNGEYILESEKNYLQDERLNEIKDLLDDLYLIDTPNEEQQKQIEALEQEQNNIEEISEEENEIYQWYIVSTNALWYLKEMGELVLYSNKLDCYVWGVSHYGTSWDYVLTSFKLNQDYSSIIDIM